MENMENTVSSISNSSAPGASRQRRSIFGGIEKPKADETEPKILLNGDTLEDWHQTKNAVENNFCRATNNSQQKETHEEITVERKGTGSFYVPPENPISRVIITNPIQTSCIRPSSVGRTPTIVIQPPTLERPLTRSIAPVMNQSRIITTHLTPPPQILASSKIVPSQTSNIIQSIRVNPGPANLKRKNILVEGRPHQNVIFRHSPIKAQKVETVTEIRQVPSRVIIQDDPKTISELNKLSSLNQFLSQQYNIVNNQLNEILTKTCEKEVINDRQFLERSFNRIDDIFLRETNQALFKLQEISRCASSKGFSRGSNSRVKRNPSPSFLRTQPNLITNTSNTFTPVKGVEQMQNSSYTQCNHIDPMAIYDEEI